VGNSGRAAEHCGGLNVPSLLSRRHDRLQAFIVFWQPRSDAPPASMRDSGSAHPKCASLGSLGLDDTTGSNQDRFFAGEIWGEKR
jgi:hypothetical protein